MKSMKQIADELNVTKMTVYNNAKKTNIKFQKVDNVNYLTSEDEIIVKKRIRKNQNKYDNFVNDKNEKIQTSNDNLVKEETIKHLYNQLNIYKEQSNRDKEQINTLNRLLENQQILALESNKKIEKLESELKKERQLNYSFKDHTKYNRNVDTQEVTISEENKNMKPQQDEEQPVEDQHKNIPEGNKNKSAKEVRSSKKGESSEVIEDNSNNSEDQIPKKGFWTRLFGG